LIKAELHRKVNGLEGAEDVLTSNVFGVFSYLPHEAGLIPFLKRGLNLCGENPDFLDNIADVEYIFWPKTTGFKREPDLLLILTTAEGDYVTIIVECKYHSGKSNREAVEEEESNGDQLAEQFRDLLEDKIQLNQELLSNVRRSKKYLFYITKHYAIPVRELEESAKQFLHHRNDMYWLSWRRLPEVIRETLTVHHGTLAKGTRLALEDVEALVKRKNLTVFCGFQIMKIPEYSAFFQRRKKRFFEIEPVQTKECSFWGRNKG
jgi:hypothetical protein